MSVKDMLKVMVVDDHITSRMVTVEGLQKLGIKNIAVAKDGREGFDKLMASPVHLLISDLYMPGVNGFQLIKALRTNPKTAKMATILLTGKKDANVVNTAKTLGVNNVLAKPFNQLVLQGAIESVVGKLG